MRVEELLEEVLGLRESLLQGADDPGLHDLLFHLGDAPPNELDAFHVALLADETADLVAEHVVRVLLHHLGQQLSHRRNSLLLDFEKIRFQNLRSLVLFQTGEVRFLPRDGSLDLIDVFHDGFDVLDAVVELGGIFLAQALYLVSQQPVEIRIIGDAIHQVFCQIRIFLLLFILVDLAVREDFDQLQRVGCSGRQELLHLDDCDIVLVVAQVENVLVHTLQIFDIQINFFLIMFFVFFIILTLLLSLRCIRMGAENRDESRVVLHIQLLIVILSIGRGLILFQTLSEFFVRNTRRLHLFKIVRGTNFLVLRIGNICARISLLLNLKIQIVRVGLLSQGLQKDVAQNIAEVEGRGLLVRLRSIYGHLLSQGTFV